MLTSAILKVSTHVFGITIDSAKHEAGLGPMPGRCSACGNKPCTCSSSLGVGIWIAVLICGVIGGFIGQQVVDLFDTSKDGDYVGFILGFIFTGGLPFQSNYSG